MTPRTIQNVLMGLMIVGLIFQGFRVGQAQELAESYRIKADSIAAEALVDAFASDSTWDVQFATQADDLAQQFLESGDTARVRLGNELADANVRIGFLTTVLASAQGEVISVGNRVGALSDELSETTEVCGGTWAGEIDDGLLTASWGFVLPAIQHTLNYSVEIPGEIVQADAGDGRTIVSARATHPRASLALESIYVDPPDPIVEVKLSKKQAVVAFFLGVIGWEVAR